MTFNRNFIKYWFPVFFWMCLIFWMSTEIFSSQNTFSLLETVWRFLVPHISLEKMVLIHGFIRKAAHVIEYFILGLLLFRAFHSGFGGSWNWRWFLFTLIILVLWGVSDELHQSFVPTRTASVVDVGIDTAGGIFGQLVSILWHRYRKK